MGLVLGVLLTICGAVVLIFIHAPPSTKLEAFLKIRETFQNLLAILFPKTGAIRVVDATEMSYTLRIPCRTGWFWIDGTPKKGTLFFVKVPLGFIAKLPGEDVNGHRFIDASSMCFAQLSGNDVVVALDGAGFVAVELLQRCRRWQVLIDGGEGQEIKTSNDILIRAHVAVHTRIEDSIINETNMEKFFSDHQGYVFAVKSHVIRTLRMLASSQDYASLVLNTEKLCQKLNDGWEELSEEDATPSSKIVTTYFSGVVLKLLVEQEEARLQSQLIRYISTVETGLATLESDKGSWENILKSKVIDAYQDLATSIEGLTAFRPVSGTLSDNTQTLGISRKSADDSKGAFSERLRNSLNSSARSMVRQTDPRELEDDAKNVIPPVQGDLIQDCDKITHYASKLHDAIVELQALEQSVSPGSKP